MQKPNEVAMAIFVNSLRSGLLHTLTNILLCLMNCHRGSTMLAVMGSLVLASDMVEGNSVSGIGRMVSWQKLIRITAIIGCWFQKGSNKKFLFKYSPVSLSRFLEF